MAGAVWLDPLSLCCIFCPVCLSVQFPMWTLDPHCHLFPSSLCPNELLLMTGLPRQMMSLVYHLTSGCQWTDSPSSTWFCPPCLDPMRLHPIWENTDLTQLSSLQKQSALGWHILDKDIQQAGCRTSTFVITVLKPGSQCNHNYQAYDRFVFRFSLTHFSS